MSRVRGKVGHACGLKGVVRPMFRWLFLAPCHVVLAQVEQVHVRQCTMSGNRGPFLRKRSHSHPPLPILAGLAMRPTLFFFWS
jgi:hypothetical protein